MKRMMRHTRTAAALALLIGAGLTPGCERQPSTPESVQPSPADAPPQIAQRANPASARCIEVGGRLVIEKSPAGGEFGVCYFEDNHQCEEWALLRGECPAGGRRITGYATQAGRYCAITGGQYTDVTGNDASDERGTCILPGGKKCEAEAYYRGTCTK
jgi:putative hemolysin